MSDWVLLVLSEASIRAAVVTVVVGASLGSFRVRAGRTRHAAWASAVIAMLFMPLLSCVLPRLAVTIPAPGFAPSDTFHRLPSGMASRGVSVSTAARGPVPDVRPDAPPPPRFAPRASSPGLSWPDALVIAWVGGVLLMAIRIAAGARAARRLARGASPVEGEGCPDGLMVELKVAASARVRTPVTVGFRSPRVILPADWRSWPAATLRAVLAHERAHVRRRDPLVGLLAAVTRALFWFNPLAWWLERSVAASAEVACDDEAVRTVGDAQGYARVLVEMADRVRRNGGRVSWAGAGMEGRGLVERRVRRLLRGGPLAAGSRSGVLATVTACGIATVAAASCQPSFSSASKDADPILQATEASLRRAQQIHPGTQTARELGEFYGAALVGTFVEHEQTIVGLPPKSDRFRQTARHRLAESNDVAVLMAAAEYVDRAPRPLPWEADPEGLIQACARRALAIDPASIEGHALRVELRRRARLARAYAFLSRVAVVSQYAAASELPEAERFELAADLAEINRARAESAAASDEVVLKVYVDRSRELARRFAVDVVELSPRFHEHPGYGVALSKAHVALGWLALEAGDRQGALAHLREAAFVPPSEDLIYAGDIEARTLVRALVEAGEREAVAPVLERLARVNLVKGAELLDEALAWRASLEG